MSFQERYNPVSLAPNGVYTGPPGIQGTGGFLCNVSGTLTLVTRDGITRIAVMPVTAGVYTPLPFIWGSNFIVTLAGGASGVLGLQA